MCFLKRCFKAVLLFFIFAVVSASLPVIASTSSNSIVYWYRNYDSPYLYQVLDLALSKTKKNYGPYQIVRSDEVTQSRALASLNSTSFVIDIVNVVPNQERKQDYLIVDFAIDKGLIGYRVCAIHKDTKGLFENLTSLSDVIDHGILFGQNEQWPDYKILKQNGLKIVASTSFQNLMNMLERQRYHCFLRGAHEVHNDVEKVASDSLIIEPKLTFFYESKSLFFVGKKNSELAKRIEEGLKLAQEDGSFDKLFDSFFKEKLDRLKLNERVLIKLSE